MGMQGIPGGRGPRGVLCVLLYSLLTLSLSSLAPTTSALPFRRTEQGLPKLRVLPQQATGAAVATGAGAAGADTSSSISSRGSATTSTTSTSSTGTWYTWWYTPWSTGRGERSQGGTALPRGMEHGPQRLSASAKAWLEAKDEARQDHTTKPLAQGENAAPPHFPTPFSLSLPLSLSLCLSVDPSPLSPSLPSPIPLEATPTHQKKT